MKGLFLFTWKLCKCSCCSWCEFCQPYQFLFLLRGKCTDKWIWLTFSVLIWIHTIIFVSSADRLNTLIITSLKMSIWEDTFVLTAILQSLLFSPYPTWKKAMMSANEACDSAWSINYVGILIFMLEYCILQSWASAPILQLICRFRTNLIIYKKVIFYHNLIVIRQ